VSGDVFVRWDLSAGIAAPREIVFDVIATPYLAKTPRAMSTKLRVVEHGEDMVLAEHFTPIGRRLSATTVDQATPAKKKSTRKRTAQSRPRKALDIAAVREWAHSNGYTVGDRGRIPASIVDASGADR
jgi:hypothetical protein